MKAASFGSASYNSPLEPMVLVLPGFPGVRSKQNREIAERIARETGLRSIALLYSGLGHAPGQFSFQSCVSEVLGFTLGLREAGVTGVHLVGHSWGGFLSLVVASQHQEWVKSLTLLSPLLKFAPEETCIPWFTETALNNPDISLLKPENLSEAFQRVSEQWPPRELIKKLAKDLPVLYLQAKVDALTPLVYAEEAREDFPPGTEMRIVDNDHSFLSDRADLSLEIARFISTSGNAIAKSAPQS